MDYEEELYMTEECKENLSEWMFLAMSCCVIYFLSGLSSDARKECEDNNHEGNIISVHQRVPFTSISEHRYQYNKDGSPKIISICARCNNE